MGCFSAEPIEAGYQFGQLAVQVLLFKFTVQERWRLLVVLSTLGKNTYLYPVNG
jgi:hypothetical protein